MIYGNKQEIKRHAIYKKKKKHSEIWDTLCAQVKAEEGFKKKKEEDQLNVTKISTG
jgi:hypothetical protein